ncbi:hypothetical protein [Singulisphaera sp. PoT]
MDPVTYFGTVFFLFIICLLAAGILGRGWFLWASEDRNGKPRDAS